MAAEQANQNPDPLVGSLSDSHRDLISSSGITDEVCQARGYRTATTEAELGNYEFATTQRIVPALVMPIRSIDGKVVSYQIRPDQPRTCRGQVAKYEVPHGSKLPIDVPPSCRDRLLEGDDAIYIVEGVRQADAAASHGLCCINTLGAGIHPGSNTKEAKNLLAREEWNNIPLSGRQVILAFSSVVTSDSHRLTALRRLAEFLQERGAIVKVIEFESEADGSPVGLDDYLAAGHGIDDLLALAKDLAEFGQDGRNECPYVEKDGGIWWLRPSKEGFEEVPLTNFTARIVAELTLTDGVDEHKEFEMEATVAGQRQEFVVPAGEFRSLNWVHSKVGARASIFAGHGNDERVRDAIQRISMPIRLVDVKNHLGWFEQDGVKMFAHGGGLIMPTAMVETSAPPRFKESDSRGRPNPAVDDDCKADVAAVRPQDKYQRPVANALPDGTSDTTRPQAQVLVPEHSPREVRSIAPTGFEGFNLPEPPMEEELPGLVTSVLQLIELGPDDVMIPLLSGVFAAPIMATNFTLFLDGPTESQKTTRAALIQQFFRQHDPNQPLPGSFDSTANALAAQLFCAKDVVFVVDDWRLGATRGERTDFARKADFLIRAQANQQARSRARGDGSLREGKPPRGLLTCTGEAMPPGDSLGRRMLRLDCTGHGLLVPPTLKQRLDQCQAAAARGDYAKVIAAFIQYWADHPHLGESLDALRIARQQKFLDEVSLPRQTDTVARLFVAMEMFLDFGKYVMALDSETVTDLLIRVRRTFIDLLHRQRRDNIDVAPGTRVCQLIATALLSGEAYLEGLPERVPDNAEEWGWRVLERNDSKSTSEPGCDERKGSDATDEGGHGKDRLVSIPQGQHIGYIDQPNVYLLPEKTLGVVLRMARVANEDIEINTKTLGRALEDRGYLLEHRSKRLTTRQYVGGKQVNCYLVRSESIENAFGDLDREAEEARLADLNALIA